MATINCKVGQNSSWYKVYIEYSYTQNIEANTSTITAALKLQQLTDYNDFDTVSSVTVGFNMAGTTYSKTQRINIDDKGNTGYTITLASGTKTVTHDSNGEKTITFSCSNTSSLLNCSGWGPGNITLSTTSVKLKTIPRNAEIDKITNSSGTTISSVNVGSAIKVYYTPTVSNYYHRLVFYVDSTKKKTVSLGKAGSTSQKSYSITLPASWLPSSSSGTLKCYLYTYSDSGYSTKIGSTDSTSISLKVPDTTTYNPTTSLAITPTYNNNLNVYLKGISKATFKITGTPGSGASISSYSLSGSGVSSTQANTTVTLNTSGTDLEYTATVKDSRGRSDDDVKKITVYNYSKPKLSGISVTRCDADKNVSASGTCILAKVTASVQSIDGKNSIASLTWSYRRLGNTTWNSLGDITSGESTVTSSNYTFSTSKTYQFKFTVTDAVGTTVNSGIYTVAQSGRPLNIARYNNGVAIGQLSSVTTDDVNASKFECAWPARFMGTNDASATSQNEVPLRIGSDSAEHIDVDSNEIMAKDSPTTLGTLALSGAQVDLYSGTTRVLRVGQDDTSEYVESDPTYARTYDASPNMYITSNGVFGRGTSSSQRYKTNIENVKDDILNPYNVLNIPVRQFKYNEDSIPVNKNKDDLYIGFIAEEVESAYHIAAEYNEDGQVEMWNIKVIVPAMLKIIQDQQKTIEQMQKDIEELKIN